jgi:tetratricopeptide (TPR) repeat protein
MSIIVGFTILAMALLIVYMTYRLYKTRQLLVLLSLCLQLFSITIAVNGFIKKVQSSNLVEGCYILFGIVIPAGFLLFDYIRMIQKVKKQGVFSGLVETVKKEQNANPHSLTVQARICPIQDEIRVSELTNEIKVQTDELIRNMKSLLQKAHGSLADKDYENAYRTYDILLNLIRTSPSLFYNHGNINFRMGNYEQSVKCYKKALELLDRENTAALENRIRYNLANALLKQGDFERAVEQYRKCIDKQPEMQEAYENIALGLAAAGQVEEAVGFLKKLMEKHGAGGRLHFLSGILYHDVREYEKAVVEFRECIRLDPEKADAYEVLGKACTSLKLFKEAENSYRKLVSLRPEDYKGLYSLGTSLYYQGMHKEAIEVFEKVLELNPKSAKSCYNMAMAYEDLHEYAKAIEAYRDAIRVKGDFIEAYNNLGVLLSTRGRNYEALEVYSAGLKRNPGEYSLYYNTGITLSDMGRNAEAETAFRKALESKPEEHEIRYHLASVLTEMKKYNEAVECYKSVLQSKPEDSDIFYNIATVYSVLKKHDIAIDNLKKAIELKGELKDSAIREMAFASLKTLPQFKELVG